MKTLRRLTILAAVLALAATPAFALKVATWNLLAYDQTTCVGRQDQFRTVMSAMNPDIVIAQELNSAAGKDSFLVNVLNVVQPGEWTAQWLALGTEGGAIFWKPAKVSVSNFATVATGGPRPALVGLVKPVGYLKNPGWFRLYSIHFKAGNPASTPADSTTRRVECTSLRNTLNNQVTTVVGTNFLVGGDTNFYGDWEGGYQRLTESQADNDGRCLDLYSMPGTWNQFAYRTVHTQCPCLSGCGPNFSGGGMDDRFDMILQSTSLRDGAGLDLIATGYKAFGNDGLHYNDSIDGGGFNTAVPLAVATALRNAADHIPVVLELQLPAKTGTPSAFALGDAIVGATHSLPLTVTNTGTVPADTLRYSLAAPAGFTAPAGSFKAASGVAGNAHAIGLVTATPGVLTGTLTVNANDPDTLAKSVQLSGRVLAHASASLDSAAVVTNASGDFGEHPAAGFTDLAVRVHNFGWTSLKARLSVNGAAITGGAGRFSIPGGFAGALLAGVGVTLPVHFDAVGATTDSTYTATLTLTGTDEALPGATAAAPLTVNLQARVSTAGVGDGPGALQFLPPRPNPARGIAEMAFELPREQAVDLAVYDLGGRRVQTLASGILGAGHHSVRWNTRTSDGRIAPAGLYFVRFQSGALSRVSRLVLLP
ncbi:MAG: hypothetical protein U0704_02315 [Candidatus Eisenbacteria bacterium]